MRCQGVKMVRPDHGLTHLLHLSVGSHSSRGWVGIEDDLKKHKELENKEAL